MKSKTKVGAVLVAILVAFMAVFMVVQSFGADSLYLNVSDKRENNDIYKVTAATGASGDNFPFPIWKIVDYASMDASAPARFEKPIYCVNPEVGFPNTDSATPDRMEYTYSFNMKNLTGLAQKYRDIIPADKYNSILWILDNMYLPKQTPEAARNATKQALYEAAGINRDLLTDNDIEVVQQFALWYYTSNNPKYHYEPANFPAVSWNNKIMENGIYNDDYHDGIDPDPRRYNDMKKLYTYFINSANSNSAAYGTADVRSLAVPTLSFTKPADGTYCTVETIGGVEYFKFGPYEIQANNTTIPYTISSSVKDQDGNAITNYKIFNSSNTEIDGGISKELIKIQNVVGSGKEFYIAVPTTNTTAASVTLKVTTTYVSTNATLWTRTEPTDDVQPVVIPEKEVVSADIEKTVNIRRPQFDLALRKFITKVNTTDITSRVPQVNTTALKAGTSTTATYTHPKDAIKVKNGDLVTYTIRVYNEGDIAGYAKEITDYIPEGLEYVVTDPTNVEYMWELSTDRTKVTTHYLEKDPLDNDNLIAAFNKDTMDVPAFKDVKVVFKVTEPNSSKNKLVNIAEVSDDTDANGNAVTDRDSTPNNVNTTAYNPPADNSSYQEDDDDYEQLILAEFDLSLRKFITKVNNSDVTSRIPVVDVSGLKAGTSTTATYTHPKTPVQVSTGDLVTYTIRIYNEGEVSGYAEEVTDDIPQGLRFVPENPTNIEYGWTLSEDRTKITTNYLSKAKSADNLIASFNKDAAAPTLAYKDVKVVFEVIEPNGSDRILINIAEISNDADEKGNPVTDRDSTPNNNVPTEDDIDKEYLKLVNDEEFDLALRKFITKVNATEITTRVPEVDVSELKEGHSTTATYTHPKTPVLVETGDLVTYTIRVYNEGDIAGFAEEVTDDIPDGLRYVSNNPTNIEYMWKLSEDGTKITTNYLSKAIDENNLIPAFNKDEETLAYKDVKVVFEVIEPNGSDKVLINIAEISEDADENGSPVEDRDSTPNNNVPTEDDIDKEYLKLKANEIFDLSLRKFITKLNENVITSREPVITNLDKLATGEVTTATYTHPKTPIVVQNGNLIVYTLRVYNEGNIDGKATEITDYVPEGLEFVKDSETNKEYKWTVSEDGKTVSTKYLEDTVIKAFNKGTKVLDYKDVKIELKVVEPNTSEKVLRNIAEISNDSGDDIDSNPDNVDTKTYNPPTDNSSYQEDDDDYEQVKLQYFDLALRKFITKVGANDVKTRYPVVSKDKNGKIVYTHPKDPVLVANGDIVIYTIRVYNEGPTAGYAKEITDDIPQGLAYLPKHETNIKYGWKVSEDGKKVTTDYLSKEKSDERNEDNLLKAFNKNAKIDAKNPDFRDVQIAFKVTETNLASNRIIINTAEISDDSDENGKPIDDIDSTPNNNKPGEDDIDNEYLKVKYFDLALLKWVSKAIVTENGETKVTNTGHTGLENPEPTVKVDLDRKNLNNVTVKFEYTIKVTNEGEIEGYAKEVSDYIPEGLKFIKEDNPDWTEKNGKIVTRKLENTLLKPGQSATVTVILTWINGEDNVGLKVNVAEISEDYNEYNSKDIDSTPNNKKDGEDDIDDAPVLLTIRTGIEPKYVTLSLGCMAILSTGIILIKKYVIK